MKLIPFSHEHLRLDATLPFGVRNGSGQLLLVAGAQIDGAEQLAQLSGLPLFADEEEFNEWRRKLGGTVDTMLRQNTPLKALADAVPQEDNTRERPAPADLSVPDQWESLGGSLDTLLRDAQPNADFIQRVRLVHERAGKLGQRHVDTSLYHLIHTAGHSTQRYSAHHALLVMLVCEQAATLLGWKDASVRSLGGAALTMNVAMSALQDELATTAAAPTAAQREQIQQHAQQGAALLREAGVDALWCDTVRLHHDAGDAQMALAELPEERQLARLLRRADIFTAKISARRTRAPMSPVQAAREACLGPAGVPDEVGGALLRATGLYPPGSFVELANGERGIVVSRGRRANLPWVASLVAPSGMPIGEPALRDTLEARFAVRSAVASALVKVRPDHKRILALR